MSEKKFAVIAVGDRFGKDEGETVGYLDHCRVKVGQRLMVTEKQFSSRWMKRLSDREGKEVQEEKADSESDKAKGKKSAAVL